jgi:hypothetical protein
MSKCIVCLTDNNLNTHMNINLESESYEVYLCDEHAENTTMGAVNNKVKEIRDKLRNALQLAKDLGITIPEMEGMKDPNSETPITPIIPTIVPIDNIPVPNDVPVPSPVPALQTNVIKRNPKPIQLSEDISINQDTSIEMQTINAKGGTVDIPKHTSGDAGETDIHIVNTTDSMLQERAKMMSAAAEQGLQQNSYSSACLACKGTGNHPVLKSPCPKCKGTGMILR